MMIFDWIFRGAVYNTNKTSKNLLGLMKELEKSHFVSSN